MISVLVLLTTLGTELDGGTPELTTVVTALRSARPARDVPSAVTVLPRSEIEGSPTLTTDALLRTVPSVATFRPNSSIVADPTAQGLNLRAVGPSGVSRALVLLDGVPANEPFGNWVFWSALPRIGLDRVEISPGPSSGLYGNSALGGVVQLISRPLTPLSVDLDVAGGNLGLLTAAGRVTHRVGTIAAGLEGEFLRADGYSIVRPSQAGAIDGLAGGQHGVVTARLEWEPSPQWSIQARGGSFNETQNGGTTFTTSHIEQWNASLRAQHLALDGSDVTAIAFARGGTFTQQRARVSPDRSSESLSATQVVPTSDVGGSVVWSGGTRHWGVSQIPTAGLDFRRAEGTSRETLVPAVTGTDALTGRYAGGEQQLYGAFIQDELIWRALHLVATLRYDLWRNVNASLTSVRESSPSTTAAFANRFEHQLSPHLGFLIRPIEVLAIRGTAGTGFREPTLNELYRPFQVGTIRTAANEALLAEHLKGADLGFDLDPLRTLRLKATGFWNQLESAVSNVTLASPLPDGSQRQRQNLGAARIAGAELSLEARPAQHWVLLGTYVFTDARVTDAGSNTALFGKNLPLAPQHRAMASVTFDDPRIATVTVQLLFVGPSFEDDLNTLPMGGYPLLNVSVRRRLRWGFEMYAAVENLFDRRYLVGRSGIDTLGAPISARVGLRLSTH